MAVEVIGTGNDDGSTFGRSDEKIGFYGLATPIIKATLTQAVVAASTIGTINKGILEIQAALANLGLITTV